MNKTTERFSEATNQSIETAREFISTSLESIEKITRLNLDASKKLLEETSEAIKEMSAVNNPKELFDRVNRLATHSVETNISNCRDLYELLTGVQAEFGKLFETHMLHAQQSVADAVDGLSNLAPSKSNLANESFKSWMSGANQAINTMSKMASQVSEFANNNIKAATTATVNAVKKTAAKK